MNEFSPGRSTEILLLIRRRFSIGIAVLVLPAVLMLVVMAAKFDGLREPAALDHAQLARHVAKGEGLTTSVIRPLSLAFKADLRHHPDLYNAPVHVLVVAGFFKLFGPTSRVAVGAGAVLWVLAVWLTFLLGWRWFGWQAGLLAAFLYGCNVTGVAAVAEGLPHPLYSIVTTACIWICLRYVGRRPRETDLDTGHPDEESETDADKSAVQPADRPWRIVGAGAACGVATLTHFPLGCVAVVIGWSIVVSQPGRWRGLGMFSAGFLAAMAPWLIRVWAVTGSPFANLYSFEALSGTGQFPGEAVWRYAVPPDHPALFVFHHPVQASLKYLSGLQAFRGRAVETVDPFVLFPFLVALFDRSFTARWRWALRIGLAGLLITSLVGSLLRPDPSLLLAWTPLLCIISAGWLCEWLPSYTRRMAERLTRRARVQEQEYSRDWAQWWVQMAAYSAIFALAAMPFMQYVFVARPVGDPRSVEDFTELVNKTSPGASVLTDQPALVAWNANRLAVWLPQREQDLSTLEQTFGPFDASLVTASIAQIPMAQHGDWWYWVVAPKGVFHGLSPVDSSPPKSILRVRTNVASR